MAEVTLPGLEATWDNGYLPRDCYFPVAQHPGEPQYGSNLRSREDFEAYADAALACTGASVDQRIVECWGPVKGYDGDVVPCRLQNLKDDYAFVETLRVND